MSQRDQGETILSTIRQIGGFLNAYKGAITKSGDRLQNIINIFKTYI